MIAEYGPSISIVFEKHAFQDSIFKRLFSKIRYKIHVNFESPNLRLTMKIWLLQSSKFSVQMISVCF